MIKCGHCQGRHETVAQVRQCQAFRSHAATPQRQAEESSAAWDFLNQQAQAHIDDVKAKRAYAEREAAQERQAYQGKMEREARRTSTAVLDIPVKVTKDGMYRTKDGRIFKVQFNRAQGDGRRLYAKQLFIALKGGVEVARIDLDGLHKDDFVEMEFRYAGIAPLKFLAASDRMSLEDAAKFGRLYGRCVRCGRELTLEESIERAMGRTCASKM